MWRNCRRENIRAGRDLRDRLLRPFLSQMRKGKRREVQ